MEREICYVGCMHMILVL